MVGQDGVGSGFAKWVLPAVTTVCTHGVILEGSGPGSIRSGMELGCPAGKGSVIVSTYEIIPQAHV